MPATVVSLIDNGVRSLWARARGERERKRAIYRRDGAPEWQHRLGAWCWLTTALYFAVEPVVASAWGSSYSFVRDTISILGVTDCVPAGDLSPVAGCSPRHVLLNGSFVVLGLLTGAGAILLRRQWPRRKTTVVGLMLFAVASLSTTATGLFPVNLSVTAHSAVALPQFPLQNLGVLLLSCVWWRDHRRAATFGLLCGAAGLAGMLLFFGATPLGLGLGAPERLALYPKTVWTAVVGALVLLHSPGDVLRSERPRTR